MFNSYIWYVTIFDFFQIRTTKSSLDLENPAKYMFKQLCCKIGFDTAEDKPPQRGKLCWMLLADAAEQRTSLRGLSAAAPVSAGRTPCG